eukprot:208998-Amphidinium_carterae.2
MITVAPDLKPIGSCLWLERLSHPLPADKVLAHLLSWRRSSKGRDIPTQHSFAAFAVSGLSCPKNMHLAAVARYVLTHRAGVVANALIEGTEQSARVLRVTDACCS